MATRCCICVLPSLAGGRLLADDPPISADVIQSRLEAVDKSATLAKDAKATIRDLYQRALAALQTASKEAARSQQFSQMARTAPEDLGRARRRLSVLPEAPELTSTGMSA